MKNGVDKLENNNLNLAKTNFVVYSTPFGCYMYDANLDNSVKISKELKYKLANLSNTKIIQINEEIDYLSKHGYFQEYIIDRFIHPSNNNLEIKQKRSVSVMVLQTTQRCNLRCEYCPYSQSGIRERTHSQYDMSFETATKSIDFLYEHSIDEKKVIIDFYGGEPLIAFELIKKVISYSSKKFGQNNLIYRIITNGTLIDDEIINFFIEHNVFITVSLDGIKEVNDKYRKFAYNKKSVFECVMTNLEKIYSMNSEFFKKNISINMVQDPSILYNEYKKIFIKYPFLREITINAIIRNDVLLNDKNVWSSNFIQEREYELFLLSMKILRKWNTDSHVLLVNGELKRIEELD